MWRIKSIKNNIEMEIPYLSVNMVDVTARTIYEKTSTFAEEHRIQYPKHLLKPSPDQIPSPGRDAIEFWGEQAVGEYKYSDEESIQIQMFEKRALTLLDGKDNNKLLVAAWHDRTFVVIAVSHDIEEYVIEYTPEEDDEKFTGLISNNFSDVFEHQANLELRAYFGEQSTVIDTVLELDRTIKLYAKKGAGIIIGFAVNLLGKPREIFEHDPFWKYRIDEQSKCFPGIVKSYPDLTEVDSINEKCVIIFIHGTFSCGIRSLHDLALTCSLNIYRFEHDTFLSIEENAMKLAQLIDAKVNKNGTVEKLLFAGHSRGGLVAKLAASKISQTIKLPIIKVWTFGTPHAGTPMATAFSSTLALFYKAEAMLVNTIPLPTPLNVAFSYLLANAKEPPFGIGQMQPGSQFYKAHDFHGTYGYLPFAGDLTIFGSNKNQYIVAFWQGLSQTAFGVKENDSVVAVDSAVNGVVNFIKLNCSHFDYFKEKKVKKAFEDFCEYDYLPSSEFDIVKNEKSAKIEEYEDYVIIGGIKVPKKMVT